MKQSLLLFFLLISLTAFPQRKPRNLPSTAVEYIIFACSAFEQEHDTARALDYVSEAIKLDSNNSFALSLRGMLYYLIGDFSDAISDFDQAIFLDSPDPFNYLYRGRCYYKQGRYQKALLDADKAIQLDPFNADHYSLRADIKEELGDIAGAETDRLQAAKME